MLTAWYRSTRATRPIRLDLTWDRLAQTLCEFRDHQGSKSDRLRIAPMWSPVDIDGTRAAAHVRSVSCLVLDYDSATLDTAIGAWDGYARAGHTTWSHDAAAPRCRVVMPLDRPVPGPWWSAYYKGLLALDRGPDRACSDPARAYYLPCVGVGGPHEAIRCAGRLFPAYADAARLHHTEQERRRRVARRRAAAAREPVTVTDPTSAARLAIDRLDTSPGLRLDVGHRYGARISATGDRARRATCPACGRPSVWWYIDRTGPAMCDHRSSCGYSRRLYWYVVDLEGGQYGSR